MIVSTYADTRCNTSSDQSPSGSSCLCNKSQCSIHQLFSMWFHTMNFSHLSVIHVSFQQLFLPCKLVPWTGRQLKGWVNHHLLGFGKSPFLVLRSRITCIGCHQLLGWQQCCHQLLQLHSSWWLDHYFLGFYYVRLLCLEFVPVSAFASHHSTSRVIQLSHQCWPLWICHHVPLRGEGSIQLWCCSFSLMSEIHYQVLGML